MDLDLYQIVNEDEDTYDDLFDIDNLVLNVFMR